MKVTITKDANLKLKSVLGEEPTIKLNEIRTTG